MEDRGRNLEGEGLDNCDLNVVIYVDFFCLNMFVFGKFWIYGFGEIIFGSVVDVVFVCIIFWFKVVVICVDIVLGGWGNGWCYSEIVIEWDLV